MSHNGLVNNNLLFILDVYISHRNGNLLIYGKNIHQYIECVLFLCLKEVSDSLTSIRQKQTVTIQTQGEKWCKSRQTPGGTCLCHFELLKYVLSRKAIKEYFCSDNASYKILWAIHEQVGFITVFSCV